MGFWQQVYLKKVAQILCNFWAFLEGITFQIKKLSAATFWATLAIVGQLFNLTSGHTKLKELWHKNTNDARAQVPLCAIPVWARALVSECGSRARRHSSVPTTRQDGIMREREIEHSPWFTWQLSVSFERGLHSRLSCIHLFVLLFVCCELNWNAFSLEKFIIRNRKIRCFKICLRLDTTSFSWIVKRKKVILNGTRKYSIRPIWEELSKVIPGSTCFVVKCSLPLEQLPAALPNCYQRTRLPRSLSLTKAKIRRT